MNQGCCLWLNSREYNNIQKKTSHSSSPSTFNEPAKSLAAANTKDPLHAAQTTGCLEAAAFHHLGVSKNRGTPKWRVKIMENPIKMDDLGVPLFSETSIYSTPES